MTTSDMRTLRPRTNLLLAMAAAGGLVASLRLPWYGAAPAAPPVGDDTDLAHRFETGAAAVGRVLGDHAGTAAWDAFARVDLVLVALAGAVMALLVLSLAPPLAHVTRGLARLCGLAAASVVAWRLVDAPAATAGEPRVGLVAALACALGVVACLNAAVPRARRGPAPVYTPPPPPAYDTSASYGPPIY
jgi:hypothetical protein